MKHLCSMLQCKPKEWRRIAKAIHVFDYLCKNGAPRIIQDVKDDLYKIRAFSDFSFKESNGTEQGFELRDKVKSGELDSIDYIVYGNYDESSDHIFLNCNVLDYHKGIVIGEFNLSELGKMSLQKLSLRTAKRSSSSSL